MEIAKESLVHFEEKYIYIYRTQGGQGLAEHISEAQPTLRLFLVPSMTQPRLGEKPCVLASETPPQPCILVLEGHLLVSGG